MIDETKRAQKKGLYHEAESTSWTCHIDQDKSVNHIRAIAFPGGVACTLLSAMHVHVAVFTALNYTPQRRYEMITCFRAKMLCHHFHPHILLHSNLNFDGGFSRVIPQVKVIWD